MGGARTAVGTAVSQGAGKIVAVAVSALKAKPCSPCGGCRQVLYEFNPKMEVILDAGDAPPMVRPLTDFLPHGFDSLAMEQA